MGDGRVIAVALRAAGGQVLHGDQVAGCVVLIRDKLAVGGEDACDPALGVAQELDGGTVGCRDSTVADIKLSAEGVISPVMFPWASSW